MGIVVRALGRLIVLLLMSAVVFYLYAAARGMQDIVGPDFATVLASCSFALILAVPLAWVVALPDLPRIILGHRARQRWQAGRCPACGYYLIQARGSACPACGAERSEPVTLLPGPALARQLAVLALAAWLIGCVAAEGWASLDEAAFAREAEAHVSTSSATRYDRPRRWPMHEQTLYYSSTDGVTAYSPDMILP